MVTEIFRSAQIPPYGQKTFGIMLEDQKRAARLRGASGIHQGERPVLEFGDAVSTLILVNYIDERTNNVTVRTTCTEQVTFSSELTEQLLRVVEPGKPARAEGMGWYYYRARINLIEEDQKGINGPGEKVDYGVPVSLSIKMRLSRDARKVVVKVIARPADSETKTKPVVKERLLFRAFRTPDIRGILHERLSNIG